MNEKILPTKVRPGRPKKSKSPFKEGAIYHFEGLAFRCENGNLVPLKEMPVPADKVERIKVKAGEHYMTRSKQPAVVWFIDDNAGERCALGMAKKVNRFGRPDGDVWVTCTWNKEGVAQRPNRENYDLVSKYKPGTINPKKGDA